MRERNATANLLKCDKSADVCGFRRVGGAEEGGRGQAKKTMVSALVQSSLRVDFQSARVTSDSCLVLVHELHERLRLSELADRHLSDFRRSKNIQLPLVTYCGSRSIAA